MKKALRALADKAIAAAKSAAGKAIDKLQEKFPPNRIVVILTPLVFAPAAGWVTATVAQKVPGVDLDPIEVTALFATGAGIAFGKAYKWLDGWQKQQGLV